MPTYHTAYSRIHHSPGRADPACRRVSRRFKSRAGLILARACPGVHRSCHRGSAVRCHPSLRSGQMDGLWAEGASLPRPDGDRGANGPLKPGPPTRTVHRTPYHGTHERESRELSHTPFGSRTGNELTHTFNRDMALVDGCASCEARPEWYHKGERLPRSRARQLTRALVQPNAGYGSETHLS